MLVCVPVSGGTPDGGHAGPLAARRPVAARRHHARLCTGETVPSLSRLLVRGGHQCAAGTPGSCVCVAAVGGTACETELPCVVEEAPLSVSVTPVCRFSVDWLSVSQPAIGSQLAVDVFVSARGRIG